MTEKWDLRYLSLAREVASWSKDPSTKTGAVIVDDGVVSVGYNGFACRVKDTPENYLNREIKYNRIIHCEINAILWADRHRLFGATLYTWPFMSCSPCAAVVIQAGIARVVAPDHSTLDPERLARWKPNFDSALEQFNDAGVEVCLVRNI